MEARQILDEAFAAGLTLTVGAENRIRIEPRDRLTNQLREAIRAHKPAILALLEFERLLSEVTSIYRIPPDEVPTVRETALKDLEAALRCFRLLARQASE